MTRLFLATAALALLPLAALAQALTGLYDVHGLNADGSAYSGTARIEDDGTTVTVVWTVGGESYSGGGHRDGNVVVIDWGDDYAVVYTVMDDGELHGTWADGYALDRLSPR